MSFYTKFQDGEPTVTTTTTSVLQASDPVLVYSGNQKHASQATVGAISSLWSISTSSSTTSIPATGIVELSATSASFWALSTAASAGQCVTIYFNSTSTSSAQGVVTASSGAMSFCSTEASNGQTITFNQVRGAYVELTSITNTTSISGSTGLLQWAITGRSAAGVLCT